MKKIFALLALVLVVTGCTVQELDDNLERVIDTTLADEAKLSNQNFDGYQYYLPREVSLVDKMDYNTVLMYKNNKMYLYVDIISYFHKKTETYEVDDDLYFSKILNYNGKKGYINIDKQEDKYYIEIEYNYGRIEAYSNEENLNNTVLNALYILKTLKYNDIVINSLIGENKIEYQEEKYTLFESDAADNNYLDIIEDDEKYVEEDKEGEILIDEDSIQLDKDESLNN